MNLATVKLSTFLFSSFSPTFFVTKMGHDDEVILKKGIFSVREQNARSITISCSESKEQLKSARYLCKTCPITEGERADILSCGRRNRRGGRFFLFTGELSIFSFP